MVKGLLKIMVVWSLDQTYPLSETILSNEEDMRKCNHWINIRPMYNTGNNSKKAKNIQHLYLLQESKSKKIKNLNDQEQ